MDVPTRKDIVRRTVLAKRSRLDADERRARALEASERLLALPEIARATSVVAFVSIRSEIPTEPLLTALLEKDVMVLLPYVADDGALQAAAVGSTTELEPGYRGIPEPRARIPVEPSSADAVVVPGVAFDERGRRLGYGGGFYDRFLAGCGSTPTIGFCFEMQVVEDVPVAAHDLGVDLVVTDERTIRPSR
ncbi:MAG: 5-formyltetrahydrofolate cyclo-ligase [Actinomycetota bacterium]